MNKRVNVYLMCFIIFLQGFVFYGPIATVYRQAKGLSMYDIFLIESICLVLMIMFEIPWGFFADRFGYKKTLVISNILFFISKVIFYTAHSFPMFLLERVFLALSISGLSGCDEALLYSSIDEKDAEKVFGIYGACSTAGFLIASLLYSVIVKTSMENTALFTIFPYAAAVVLTLFLKDVNYKTEDKPKIIESLKKAFCNKEVLIFVISLALINEVVQSVSVFLNQPQYIKSGIDMKYFGILVVAAQIIRLSSAKAYSVTNKFGKNKSIYYLYGAITISCIFLMKTSNPIISIVCIILVQGSMALIIPIGMDIQNKAITTSDRATILSVYAMLSDIIGAFINVIIGKTADISVSISFKTCAFISISACVIFFIYDLKNKKIKIRD